MIISNMTIKNRKKQICTISIAVFLILLPMFIYTIDFQNNASKSRIIIDNNYSDWKEKNETDLTSGGDKIVPQIYIPDNGRNKPD